MIYCSSDYHLGHQAITKYCDRPFETIEEHDRHIISKINEFVGRNDKLYHLGDFCFSRRGHKEYVKTATKYLDQINCDNIYFLIGNHDKDIHHLVDHRKVKMIVPYYELYVQVPVGRHIIKELIVLNHYAQYVWNKSHHGAFHCYGHSHSTLEETLDTISPGRLSIDVGIDNAKILLGDYEPFELNWLLNYLRTKQAEV